MKKQSLSDLLFRSELRSLGGGKRWNTLVFLTLIYAFALFSLGAGQQIHFFLKAKMDNPYVKLLVAKVPSTSCTEVNVRSEIVQNEDFKKRFRIQDTQFMAKRYMYFKSTAQQDYALKVGAFDAVGHPLWTMLASDTSLFLSPAYKCKPFTAFTESGIILSEKAAIQLGVWPLKGDGFVTVGWIPNTSGGQKPVQLPVLGIMKGLPLDLEVAMHEKAFTCLLSGNANDGSLKPYYFVSDAVLAQHPNQQLPAGESVMNGYIATSAVMGNTFLSANGKAIDLLHTTGTGGSISKEYLLFQAADLSEVRALATELSDNKAKYGCTETDSGTLEIDLTEVESKENLRIFSSFAFLLSAALVLVSLILIVNYTGAILRLHINKNKRNLGSLTAFGYRNSTITNLYLLITATILGLSFTISYALVWPVGYFGFEKFLGFFGLSDVLTDVAFAHIPLFVSVPLFVLLPLLIVSYRIRKQLKATPGDLVYDR